MSLSDQKLETLSYSLVRGRSLKLASETKIEHDGRLDKTFQPCCVTRPGR